MIDFGSAYRQGPDGIAEMAGEVIVDRGFNAYTLWINQYAIRSLGLACAIV
jgi:hypothetical protein